jgi:hypothetical protein
LWTLRADTAPRAKSTGSATPFTVRDTWVKTPAGWKLQYDEIQKVDERVDGKSWEPAAASEKAKDGVTEAVRQEMQNYYTAWDRLWMDNDLIGGIVLMRERVAPVVTIQWLGRPARTERLEERVAKTEERVKRGEGLWDPGMRVVLLRTLVERVDVKGGRAIALVRQWGVDLRTDKQGRTRRVLNLARYRDTWVRTPDGWRQRSAVELQDDWWVDGKPLPPGTKPNIKSAAAP